MPIRCFEAVEALEAVSVLEKSAEVESVFAELAAKLESPEIKENIERVHISDDAPVLSIDEFNARFSDIASKDGIVELSKTYPEIEKKIESMQDRLKDAEGPRDLQQLDLEGKQYRGIMAEDMVKETLRQNFEKVAEKQETVATEFGNTRPDAVFRDSEVEFSLDDLHVEKGDDLYIEVKTGSKDYIQSEMGHILNQVEGHEGESAVVVSSDYLEIATDRRADFEEKLAEKDSCVVVMDTTAKQIDDAFVSLLRA